MKPLNDRDGYILPCDIQSVEIIMSNKSTGWRSPGIHNTAVCQETWRNSKVRAYLAYKAVRKPMYPCSRVIKRRDCIYIIILILRLQLQNPVNYIFKHDLHYLFLIDLSKLP